MNPQLLGFEQLELRSLLVKRGFNPQCVIPQPALIWLGGLQHVVDIFRVQDFLVLGIDRQDLARPDAAFGNHIFSFVVVGADFRSNGHEAILGHDPARRAQTVTVEHTDGVLAIGHDETSGAIPRLHVHGVILIEGA